VRQEPLQWVGYSGGRVHIGHDGSGFGVRLRNAPACGVCWRPFSLASRLVTNGSGASSSPTEGYQTPRWWLSDGWRTVRTEQWDAPLYWLRRDGQWLQMSLSGEAPVDLGTPVSQVSFYEADAYARWAGKRLPTEFEWKSRPASFRRREISLNREV